MKEMKAEEYLAEGFKDVDSTEAQSVYENCLGYIDGLSYFQKIKEQSYRLLNLREVTFSEWRNSFLPIVG